MGLQLPFEFALPKINYVPPKISELPSWRDAKRIGFDVETKDPDLKKLGPGNFRPGCHAVGYAVAIEDGPSFYLPIRHEGGDNLDEQQVLAYLRDNAKEYTGSIHGTNLTYDAGFAERDDIHFPVADSWQDISNCSVLLYELFDRYSFNAIAEREGIPGKDTTIIDQYAAAYGVNRKTEIYKLPGRAVSDYACRDVVGPLQIQRRLDKRVEEEEISRVWKMETDVLPILTKMRRRGVRVNLEKLRMMVEWATNKANERLVEAQAISGYQVRLDQVWKAEVMARPLERIGVKIPHTATGASSITGDFLEKAGPCGKALARARDYSKILQFAERTYRYQINGRIHPVFNQLKNTKAEDGSGREESKGARYGRFSSEHYNVQQEFGRDDEFGAMWRDIYEPEQGCFWVCSDWSQQEPRFAVHYAELLGLPEAKKFAQLYRDVPSTDCHQMLADATGIVRKIVKNYFNGRIYGMGDAKLCRAIGHPTQMIQRNGKAIEVPGPEGKKIIDAFTAKVPWVSMLTKYAAKQAEKVGHVWTIGGRKCHFPRHPDGINYDWTHKAFSRIGQGGAADQMKLTLIAADRAGIPVQMIVHDEFDYSEHDLKRAKLLKELQQDTVKINVPMLVDQEYGPSWGYVQKWEKGGEQFLREAGFLD